MEILGILKQTFSIIIFVIVMMLVIEYITLKTKHKNFNTTKNAWLKIIMAAMLGAIPGCLGAFAVVSMYVHKSIGLAALVAALIATSGDETFIMFSSIPKEAAFITIFIFVIAILAGFIIKALNLDKNYSGKKMHIDLHKEDTNCVCFQPTTILSQLRNIIWERAIIILAGVVFSAVLILSSVHAHGHAHDAGGSSWGWEKITFLIVTAVGLIISVTVPDHFVKKHIWNHIIKKHFIKLFLWTFGAFVVLHVLNNYIDVESWIKTNIYIIMIIAVLIGMIPESGPHIIFITLFMTGVIPISVLIANSIVQDGHGAIPLLAESQKSFLIAKGINLIVGLAVGYSMLLLGF